MEKCEEECPVEEMMTFFGQKWILLILSEISLRKVMRFNEIQKRFPKISPRTLSHRLKDLENKNFIKKERFNETPPRVEYTITKKGADLYEILDKLNTTILSWY